MNTERSLQPKNWNNASDEEVTKLLESGSPEELELFRQSRNISPEHLEFGVYYATLRKQLHEQSDAEVVRRKNDRPHPDEEEVRMGAYWESLEPHVREAMKVLRRKGYSTRGSGFEGVAHQSVILDQDDIPTDFHFSDDLIGRFQSLDAQLTLQPNKIEFSVRKKLTADELRQMWDLIAAELPDLHRPAPPTGLNYFHP